MSALIGQSLGQYKLVDLLGEGGVATVYRARHLGEQNEVAIKVIKPGGFDMADLSKQIKREALISASLRHPHIVDVFGFGEYGDNVYMVMRLLMGGSLADLVRQNSLSLDAIGKILTEVASALDYIHEQGIIHRDVKPQNILMDEHGQMFLSDFGLVKAISDVMQNRCRLLDTLWHPTKKGMIVGTPAYMSPEQCKSVPVDAASDIYSLGVMLFELLTGEVPFRGDATIETMYMHMRKDAPAPSSVRADLPPELDAVVKKALSKNPSERYSSAGQLAAAYSTAIGLLAADFQLEDCPTPQSLYLHNRLSRRFVKCPSNVSKRVLKLLEFALILAIVMLIAIAVFAVLTMPF